MRLTRAQFLDLPRKAVTLMGMSGVGKSHLTQALKSWGWGAYECDVQIGTQFLAEELARTMTGHPPVTPDNLQTLSKFVGQLGNPAKGGLGLEEFRRRQGLYIEAECASLAAARQALRSTNRDFVIDSTGSLCEIGDETLLAGLGGQTLFVYIQASAEDEKAVLERARLYPKPLYFPPAFLEAQTQGYVEEQDLFGLEQADPDDFSRWIFPHLFRARLPKYERLAARYGVTVPAAALRDVKDEGEFIDAIAKHLPTQP